MAYHIDIRRGSPDGFNVGVKIETNCDTPEEIAELVNAVAELDRKLRFDWSSIPKVEWKEGDVDE